MSAQVHTLLSLSVFNCWVLQLLLRGGQTIILYSFNQVIPLCITIFYEQEQPSTFYNNDKRWWWRRDGNGFTRVWYANWSKKNNKLITFFSKNPPSGHITKSINNESELEFCFLSHSPLRNPTHATIYYHYYSCFAAKKSVEINSFNVELLTMKWKWYLSLRTF